MLEPAVRPGGGSPASGAGKAQAPFENSSFQDLLSQAATQPDQVSDPQPADAQTQTDRTGKADTPAQPANPLGALSGLEQVENAALRRVLMQAGRQVNNAG